MERNPVYQKESQPENELFTLTIFNDEEQEQTVIVYLTIWPAAHIDYREIYAEIKLPIQIAISPEADVKYQLSAALYNEGVRGQLMEVKYIRDREQVTV